MKTNAESRNTAKLNDFKCRKPDHIDTAQENEAMDNEFTSGENPETNYRRLSNYLSDDESYEIIESGLNLAEDNTPLSTYDYSNPYDSYNLDHEDEKYNCPPYRNFEH